MSLGSNEVVTEVRGGIGFITLNRPKALNALTLDMVRQLTATLLAWQGDAQVQAVAIRGQGKDPASPSGASAFGAFCAGGDIRFFHQAALAGDPRLEDFFTEEYALNHLIHRFPKPYVAFLDGICMGGGMGLCQGVALADPAGALGSAPDKPSAGRSSQAPRIRIVTERSKLAMPETNIGLVPDVGGGWFLARCPGHVGEYLALTGRVLGADDAIAAGLADLRLAAADLPALWDDLAAHGIAAVTRLQARVGATNSIAADAQLVRARGQIDQFFGLGSVPAIVSALEADASPWAAETAAMLRKRSPVMLHVVLEQVRRARSLGLADDLRMERGLVRHCFHTAHLGRSGAASETVEGIRALAVDKDHAPRWNPARIEDVTPAMVAPFFDSPWPAHAHPLRGLA